MTDSSAKGPSPAHSSSIVHDVSFIARPFPKAPDRSQTPYPAVHPFRC